LADRRSDAKRDDASPFQPKLDLIVVASRPGDKPQWKAHLSGMEIEKESAEVPFRKSTPLMRKIPFIAMESARAHLDRSGFSFYAFSPA
jgi:hypothetical protein